MFFLLFMQWYITLHNLTAEQNKLTHYQQSINLSIFDYFFARLNAFVLSCLKQTTFYKMKLICCHINPFELLT